MDIDEFLVKMKKKYIIFNVFFTSVVRRHHPVWFQDNQAELGNNE